MKRESVRVNTERPFIFSMLQLRDGMCLEMGERFSKEMMQRVGVAGGEKERGFGE